MKDVLTEAMDIDGLKRLLTGISDGSIRCIAVDTPIPSQFSHEILNANPYAYLDDAPLEERRARAVEMRRVLPESILEEVGKLDLGAIAQVREEAWPDVRDADELHDVLHTLGALPENYPVPSNPENEGSPLAATLRATDQWSAFFEQLKAQGRAGLATVPDALAGAAGGEAGVPARLDGRDARPSKKYWVAAEKVASFRLLFPKSEFEHTLPEVAGVVPTCDDALLALVTGWVSHLGPTSAPRLRTLLGLPSTEIEKALLRMEASGAILRGKFTDPKINETEWCDRRLLARIHRLTVATLRKQIEPVTAAQFMRWLMRWQHIAPGTQVGGERGVLEVLQQIQGFEIPANAWERQILARRVVTIPNGSTNSASRARSVGDASPPIPLHWKTPPKASVV
jgi:ATP-dependent Lhr-like helicase